MNGNGRVTTADLINLIEQKTARAGRRVGKEILLLCPSHETSTSTPSLNVREGDGGYPLIRCRSAGCTPEQVLDAVGLTWPDVFGDDGEHWTPRGDWIAVYDYVDEQNTLLYQVCRTADKQFTQRQPDPDKPHGWAWNLTGVRRVPYHLPQLLEAIAEGRPVYLVDGERDVQALERAGAAATCSSGGALHFPPEHVRFFAGADVRIVVDQDPLVKNGKPHGEGQRAALRIREMVAPVAANVSLLAPKVGKDADDHLGAGFDVDALVPVTAADLEASLHHVGPAPGGNGEEPDGDPEPPRVPELRFKTGREFVEQPLAGIKPLFGVKGDGLMMPGSLMLLAGIGGAGKTTLSLHMLAHFAAGLPWFGIEVQRPIRCVVIENEGPHDPYVEKVKDFAERFRDCGCSGDAHGSDAFLDNCCFQDAPWGKFTFEDKGLAAELRAQVIDFGADLVIANPLGRLGMHGAGTPEETRTFLGLLGDAGLGDDFAALLLHHLAKVQSGTPLVQQVSGDWGPHPDTIMVMESAGERRSKLSFGKVRWGDQGRAPMILDWLTDPEGPVGYASTGAVKGVTDVELYERIDTYLREQESPSRITAVAKGVQGNGKRIRELVDIGVSSGRYVASSGTRPTYWLPGPQESMDV